MLMETVAPPSPPKTWRSWLNAGFVQECRWRSRSTPMTITSTDPGVRSPVVSRSATAGATGRNVASIRARSPTGIGEGSRIPGEPTRHDVERSVVGRLAVLTAPACTCGARRARGSAARRRWHRLARRRSGPSIDEARGSAPPSLALIVASGLTTGSVSLIITVSLGVLVFAGPVPAFAGNGIARVLASTVVAGVAFAARSCFRGRSPASRTTRRSCSP